MGLDGVSKGVSEGMAYEVVVAGGGFTGERTWATPEGTASLTRLTIRFLRPFLVTLPHASGKYEPVTRRCEVI